ncbi:MAG TPA: hypothetical protein VIP70_10865 [Nitrososphaeraceae archaeon]
MESTDKGPVFPPPQIQQVQHPFMVNTTVTSQTKTQSRNFNQTLDY